MVLDTIRGIQYFDSKIQIIINNIHDFIIANLRLTQDGDGKQYIEYITPSRSLILFDINDNVGQLVINPQILELLRQLVSSNFPDIVSKITTLREILISLCGESGVLKGGEKTIILLYYNGTFYIGLSDGETEDYFRIAQSNLARNLDLRGLEDVEDLEVEGTEEETFDTPPARFDSGETLQEKLRTAAGVAKQEGVMAKRAVTAAAKRAATKGATKEATMRAAAAKKAAAAMGGAREAMAAAFSAAAAKGAVIPSAAPAKGAVIPLTLDLQSPLSVRERTDSNSGGLERELSNVSNDSEIFHTPVPEPK